MLALSVLTIHSNLIQQTRLSWSMPNTTLHFCTSHQKALEHYSKLCLFGMQKTLLGFTSKFWCISCPCIIWFDVYCVQVILPTVKNLFALKSSQAISHIMTEGKAKVLETCSVCIMKADPASDCTVTHHKPMNETEQVSEMMVFYKLWCSWFPENIPSASVFWASKP